MQKQPWDASVKSLTAFPTVLDMMNDKLDWTQQLGDAFLAQQEDIMAAVQTLRERADKAGNLKTTKQQKVSKGSSGSQSYIEIEPQDPSVVYVPAYDPNEVYGTWPYPSYPPYYWYPPGYVAGPGIWWGAGIIGGGILWGIATGAETRSISTSIVITGSIVPTSPMDDGSTTSPTARVCRTLTNVLNDQFRRPYQGNFAASREQFRGRAEAGRAALAGAAIGPAVRQRCKRSATGHRSSLQSGSDRRSYLRKRVRQLDPEPTAFDRAGSGRNTRAASARGRASRAASINRGGGGRSSVAAADRRRRWRFRGGGGRGGGRRSDVRVKHDIVLLGRLSNGMGLYRFAYNGSQKLYVGVIAQEAMTVMPQAVSRDQEGYLRVDYDKLGVPFQTYDHWLASGARLPTLNPH